MKEIRANTLLRGVGALAENPVVTSVVTDSRAVRAGSLFVCIEGERVDGHAYAHTAMEKGAVGIVATHAVAEVPAQSTVVVGDARDALITMGGNYRDGFSPVLVGVTGSVGKTTTKEFCYAVLSAFGETLKTEGNQNNEIGMPNTLFRLTEQTRFAVVEMGMQGMGEIEKLTLAAKPCGAIISGIGVSHLEQLGTRENICKAKLEICDGLTDGAPIIMNGDDPFLQNAAAVQLDACDDYAPHSALRKDLRPVYFALENENADVRAVDLTGDAAGTHFTIVDKEHGKIPAFIPAIGAHNVMNALSAYALATRLGLEAEKAAAALANYETTGHRQHIVEHGGVTVIEDCYNASPDSMRAALRTLGDYPVRGKRIAVLGDMFELGAAEQAAHTELGDLCAKHGVSLLITVGSAAQLAHERALALGLRALHCADRAEAVQTLKSEAAEGDAVLVKASHGMEFDKLLSGFYGEDM